MKKPENCRDEQLDYLDDLRESGVTNMFGAGGYLQKEFDIKASEALEILKYWMETFGEPRS